METIEAPERAMLVIPHPDDGESGCAGTVATWARQGCKVLYVVATNGDKGSSDPEMTSERLAEIREGEQRNAAGVLGVEEVVFLGHGDGELEDNREFRGEIVRQIRRHRPDILLTMDPYRRMSHTHRDHPDHWPGRARRLLSLRAGHPALPRAPRGGTPRRSRSARSSCGGPRPLISPSISATPSTSRCRRWRRTRASSRTT